MSKIPTISVILPIYNGEAFLENCLKSILAQTLSDIEIICINDGSTDSTGAILREFARQDSRINLIEQSNMGAGVARNAGLAKAKGEFIAFLDSDDRFYRNDTLEILYHTAKEKGVQICGGSMAFKYQVDSTRQTDGFFFKQDGFVDYKSYQFDYGFYRFIYAKDLVKDIRFPHFSRFQDPPFFVEAMIKAKQFYALKEPTYLYFNPHKDISKKALLSAFEGIKLNAKLAKKYNLTKLLDYTKYRFDEHFDKFLAQGGDKNEIYKIFERDIKTLLLLTSPRKRLNEKIFSVKKYRNTKILTIFWKEFWLGKS
ncbi:glycosyltransferase family 2 protein [Helicobacter macacae]|uniref:Glycosyltransferase 2-like domain-containing protein n=1 Tax=Helicobacter macacae MIT 99-5501 TaxID=1357400 RepID=V8CDK2_9HELI|nr:glycosyltransferase [Helicobacter macacae]ETD25187.1 hypothetical protein HMPREF2086_00522 [Helicobacter macacae MIT 99-5501]